MLLTKNTGVIIGPIASLLGLVMNGIFKVLDKIGLPNTGLAIIIMTIIIYMALLPLTIRQQKFSKLQRKMQPEINKIQKKYSGRKDQDSQIRMNEEIQAVYKKYGVSATGSCIQLVIQLPILLALYRVFYSIPAYVPMVKEAFFPLVDKLIAADPSGEYMQTFNVAKQFSRQFTNESFLGGVTEYIQNTFIDVLNKFSTADWNTLGEHFSELGSDITSTVSKLSQYNNFLGINISNSPSSMVKEALSQGKVLLIIAALMIPVLAALTNWLNVKLMPTADAGDPNNQMAASMKTMNLMMPIMSAVFCYTLPSGMGLYWIVGAVIRVIQQIAINKHIDKMDIDEMIEKNVEKNRLKAEKNKQKEEKSGKKESMRKVNEYSSMSTRNIDRNDKYSTKLSQDQEQKINETRETRKKTRYKEGSLSAIANMVSDYNDSGKKE